MIRQQIAKAGVRIRREERRGEGKGKGRGEGDGDGDGDGDGNTERGGTKGRRGNDVKNISFRQP